MTRFFKAVALMLSAAHATADDSRVFTDRAFAFPGGVTKALVLSYDDGPTQDRRFVEMLNGCGLKGTFHLNSGRLGLEAEWMTEQIGQPGAYVDAGEIAELYTGHEIASHTVNHPHLTQLDDDNIRQEVNRDIEWLERLGGKPVVSLAYPFGDHDDRVVATLAQTRITSARTVQDTGSFDMPDDFLRWHPTVHHSGALDLVDAFLALDDSRPALMMIWGHSWEFDGDAPDNDWGVVDALCEKLGGRDDVWSAGAGEVIAYLQAVRDLREVDGALFNGSGQPVWVRAVSDTEVIEPR